MQPRLLRHRRQKCTLGCPVLDELLHGGIPCGSLTELVGESASAKTQLSLQLLLTVQLPVSEGGLHGSALYIYTDSYFPSRRLQDLAGVPLAVRGRRHCSFIGDARRRALRPLDVNRMEPTNLGEQTSNKRGRYGYPEEEMQAGISAYTAKDISYWSDGFPDKVPVISDAIVTYLGPVNPCRNIFVHGVQEAEELLEYLNRVHALLAHPFQMRVRLLIIDSIAALFRSDFGNSAQELNERSRLFFKVASKLKKFGEQFNLAIVVTNQVTDYFEDVGRSTIRIPGSTDRETDSEVLVTSGRRVCASLGLSWAHCVNTRLFLSRSDHDHHTLRRSMRIVFAPHLPNVSREFVVDNQGVRGIPSEQKVSSDFGQWGRGGGWMGSNPRLKIFRSFGSPRY